MLGMLALSQLQFSGLHNEGDETCRAVWLVGTQLPASTVMTCVTLGKLLILLGSCVLSEKRGWWHLPFKGVAQITWNKAINHLARDLTMEKAFKETNHDDDPSLSKSEVRRWKEKNIYIAMGKCLTNYIQFSRSAMSDSCPSVAFLTSMIWGWRDKVPSPSHVFLHENS